MTVRATHKIEAKLSDTADQLFSESLDVFDAISETWDGEVGEVADFVAEVDGDNDLNDSTDAAYDGDNGIEVTFDDANAAYGTLDADAIDQVSGVISLQFDKNDLAVEDTKFIEFATFIDGAAADTWGIRIYDDSGDLEMQLVYWNDAAALQTAGARHTIAAGYNNYKVMFSRSTGAGNNDGWMRLYVGNVLIINDTGHDNDTLDWDSLDIGIISTDSTTFTGSFYMDTIKIDPVGAPMLDQLAAKNGTYGIAFPVMDSTGRSCSFTNPTTEAIVMAEGWLDPNTITMANGNYFAIINGGEFGISLKYDSGYEIHGAVDLDAGADSTGWHSITDAPHHIRAYWGAASGAGKNDGFFYLFIDHVLVEALTGLDNDTKSVATVSFGAVTGIDAGTYGIIYMDDCHWGPWMDITSDVLKDFEGYWGFNDDDPTSFMAETGVAEFLLKDIDGKYLPGLTTTLDGWKKGTPIRLRINYSDLPYTRFYGTIDELEPTSVIDVNQNRVKVYVTDWMDYAATHPLFSPAIGTDERADEMLTTIVADMPIAPQATDFDTGVNTFPTSFDTIQMKTKAYSEMAKAAVSELGPVYLIKDPVYGETLVFKNAHARNGLRTPDATFDNNMTILDSEYGKNVINRFVNIALPKETDTNVQVLYSLGYPIRIGGHQTITVKGNFTDPIGGNPAVGANMINPVATTDYLVNTEVGGGGVNITADLVATAAYGAAGVEYTLENTNVRTGWITKLRARGYIVWQYNQVEKASEDADSIDEFGYIEKTIKQHYQQDPFTGNSYANKVVNLERQPRLKVDGVGFVANRSDALMLAWLTRDVGDLVYIIEDDKEVDEYAYILGVKFKISPDGLVRFYWVIKRTLNLGLGLTPITAEFTAFSTDALDFGYIPEISGASVTARTVSVWIYPTAGGADRDIVADYANYVGYSLGMSNPAGTGQIFITVVIGPGNSGRWRSLAASPLSVDTWYHVLYTMDIDGAVSAPEIWVDGVNQVPIVEDFAPGAGVPDTEGVPFVVGNWYGNGAYNFPAIGQLKYCEVWDRILTDAEIGTVYAAAGFGSVEDGLVFQGPCVKTKELADFEDATLTADDVLLDNMYGAVGVPQDDVVTRLIP